MYGTLSCAIKKTLRGANRAIKPRGPSQAHKNMRASDIISPFKADMVCNNGSNVPEAIKLDVPVFPVAKELDQACHFIKLLGIAAGRLCANAQIIFYYCFASVHFTLGLG
ncbi:MAG: hypothetical protein NTZ67_09820 [Gammaproteobacteria bacterium]|nr:hypothetical protein [Gammaproteobacteria bacterium]